jgi:hypothetical protein
MNSTTITSQPVFSHQTEHVPVDLYKHQCLCEKYMTHFCKKEQNQNDQENNHCCCVNCVEWYESLGTGCNGKNQDCLSTLLCLPIKLPFILIFGFPCTAYNILRNACNGTTDKNYLC